jgi:hypothetical protein
MMETLTQEVMRFKETGDGWDSLSRRIYLYAYRFPGNWTDWDEDRCSDFFLSFLPRIPGLVKRYKPDFSFETYLASSLRWYMKTYLEAQAGREHYERWSEEEFKETAAAESRGRPEDRIFNEESADGTVPFAVDARGRLADLTLRRRILYVLLLRAADVDDHRLPYLARLVDVDEEWLFDIVRKARELVAGNIERRSRLQERRNECWYLLDGARHRAGSACESDRRAAWEKKARTWKNRYSTAVELIRHLNVTPTHHDIGRMLHVPAGTVSSGLHFLRKTLNSLEQTGVPRPAGASRTAGGASRPAGASRTAGGASRTAEGAPRPAHGAPPTAPGASPTAPGAPRPELDPSCPDRLQSV